MTRLVIAVLAVVFGAARVWGDEKPSEHWYILQMDGQRCGWLHEKSSRDGENWKNQSEMRMQIRRGDQTIGITMNSDFIETADYRPVSMWSEMKLGALPQRKEFTFLPDGVEVKESAAGAEPTVTKKPPLKGAWMTPRGAEKHMTERIAAGDKEVTIRSIDPSEGLKLVTATHTLKERTTLEVVGKRVPALKWSSKVDLYPNIVSTDYTDERGHPLRTDTDIGGFKLTAIAADRELALAKMDAPELLVSMLIHPDKPIKRPRTVKKAVYVIEGTGEELTDIPTEGGQTFERIGVKTGRVTIDAGAATRPAAPKEEATDAQFTDCTAMVSCADEEVKKLAAQALGENAPADKVARAEALRKFVYKFINKKNLGVGFASAAEVARTREGDCSEHGVLLCSLLRADGIPARVVAGVVYVDGFGGQENVFGYHMWTQALLEVGGERRWIDLDAALSATDGFDATHIALATSALSDEDTTNSLVQLAPLMGTIKIRVEKAE